MAVRLPELSRQLDRPGRVGHRTYPYPAWGQVRYQAFIIFNPDIQCFRDFEGGYANSEIKTSNASGVPDSLRMLWIKIQECFRFGVSTNCSVTDGAYIDNMSLAIVDGLPIQLSSDIWNWINDTFPANETAGFAGVASKFDTCAAILKTGLNTAPNGNSLTRADIPGDSVVIISSPTTTQVDMIFRILPGPGNYSPQSVIRHTGFIRKLPSNAATVTPGDGSFWDGYRTNPGPFASPGAVAKHAAAKGGWDANVWNSARCDTAEVNIFSSQSRGVLGGPGDSKIWANYLHESDPRFRDPRAAQAALLHQDADLRSQQHRVRRHGADVRGVQRYRRQLRPRPAMRRTARRRGSTRRSFPTACSRRARTSVLLP